MRIRRRGHRVILSPKRFSAPRRRSTLRVKTLQPACTRLIRVLEHHRPGDGHVRNTSQVRASVARNSSPSG